MEAILRSHPTALWTTLTVVFSLVLLSTSRRLHPTQFFNFISLLTSDKYLILEQKQKKPLHAFHTSLNLFQVTSMGLFLYLLVSYCLTKNYTENTLLLAQILLGYLLFVMGKHLIEKIVGVLIASESLINHYLFCKMSYRNYLALIILPVNIILLYGIPPSKILLIALAILLLIGNLLAIFMIYKSHRSLIFENIFYFILYLCTLEIAPYFVLYKLF